MSVLTKDHDDSDCNDYTLNGDSCWITVENLSVYVQKGDEGVSVAVYPKGCEADDAIAETYALFSEGKEDEKNE